jgi:ABC-2 type transport system ATP-binding protein
MTGPEKTAPRITEPASSDLAISVEHLDKMFGDKYAVHDVSLKMPRGKVWGFLGPNGSGKTTTIRMICGLLRPTAGEGTCMGFDIIRDSEQIKRSTGYMTQRFSFWGDLTIRENLDFVARLYQLKSRKKVVDETIAKLGLTHRQHQLADALSGGWKQRLALAAVTMHQPDLLLLDEPTAGVDPQARREFWDEIHELSNQGMTILVSTHYMDEAERCDHIVYLAHGRLVTQGSVRDIVANTGLITFRATGPNVRALAPLLKTMPNIEHVAYFGSALHISSTDRSALEQAITLSRENSGRETDWEEVETSLEDAFIALMSRAGEDQRISE